MLNEPHYEIDSSWTNQTLRKIHAEQTKRTIKQSIQTLLEMIILLSATVLKLGSQIINVTL